MRAELKDAVVIGIVKGIALSIAFLGLIYGPHLGAAIAEAIDPPDHGIYLDIR